jgi:hypothetical protein
MSPTSKEKARTKTHEKSFKFQQRIVLSLEELNTDALHAKRHCTMDVCPFKIASFVSLGESIRKH